MYSLIFFAPLFMFFLLSVFSRWLGGYYAALALSISTLFSFFVCFDALLTTVSHSFFFSYYMPLTPLISFSWIDVHWQFGFDALTLFMYGLITAISFFIQLFSVSYMGEDASHVRFSVYLSFFMLAMMLLVGSTNFLQFFFGWELVGLASFLLINFWFARQDANAAAAKAMAVNRIGDCFLLASMFLFAVLFQTFEFDSIICLVSLNVSNVWCQLAFLFLVVGAFAKSAQFFFHSWLPDAMEGPTPVSALLHSATMVTAGVFLTLRFMDLLEVYPLVRYLVVFIGLLTAFYAMAIAAVADDTKRVTAYTTLNQLGFMFYGCGSLAFSTVLFHLVIHGFYKSFSFLTAAIELHDFEDEQDGEFDQPESVSSVGVFDVLSATVFFSVNAIPFTSPSISKEFMLLAGLEKMPDYFTFLVSLILFSSFVDEGRDDVEADFYDSSYYADDLHVASPTPSYMIAGCAGLGCCSLVSAAFLEELFLDLGTYAVEKSFFWLDIRGSILIMLPFLAWLAAEFTSSSRVTLVSDFNQSGLSDRADPRYQAVLFNGDLWVYDELVSRFAAFFYQFSYWHTNFVLDKGFLEQFYTRFPLYIVSKVQELGASLFNVTLEKSLALSVIFTFVFFILLYTVFFSGPLTASVVLGTVFYFFIYNFNK